MREPFKGVGLALCGGTATALFTSRTSTAGQEGTGQYVDSSVITTKVKNALVVKPHTN